MILSKKQSLSDILGATVSGLCAIHCAVTPLFFAARPMLEPTAASMHTSSWWASLDFLFLVLSAAAVWYSSRHTTHQGIKVIFWLSWLLFAGGLALEHLEVPSGAWLMYGGSLALIITHFQNFRHCRKCRHESCP